MERVGLCLWGDIWGSAVEMCGVGVVGSWPQGQGLGPLRAEGVWGGGVEGT